MADTEIKDLTEITTPASTDIAYVLADPTGSMLDRKATLANIRKAGNPMSAAGDIIIGGTGGAETRLQKGNDSQVLQISASTHLPVWAAVTAGTSWPDTPPASPQPENDEFDSSVLDAKWTATVSAGTAWNINTTWPSRVYALFPGNDSLSLKQAYAPTGAFSLTAKVHLASQANYQEVDLLVADETEANGLRCALGYNASVKNQFTLDYITSGTWTYANRSMAVGFQSTVYLHVQRGASDNWQVGGSLDGISFWRIGGLIDLTKVLTVHHFTLVLNQGGATIPMRAGIDWVRRDWITI